MAEPVHETPEWEKPAPRQSLFQKVHPFSKQAVFASKDRERIAEEGSTEGTAPAKPIFLYKWMPHWCAFMGRSRRNMAISIAALICLLALVLGLGLGLGLNKSSKKAANLPLPTNRGIFTGDLTYYSPGPGYGACGYENTSTDSICAVSHIIWDASSTSSNPNNNPLCGKKIRITRYDSTVGGNRSVDVEVVDRCVGCAASDLDLSLKMFTSLAEEAEGRVVGSWAWLT